MKKLINKFIAKVLTEYWLHRVALGLIFFKSTKQFKKAPNWFIRWLAEQHVLSIKFKDKIPDLCLKPQALEWTLKIFAEGHREWIFRMEGP